MNEDIEFVVDTDKLKLLISQVNNSGVMAWEAGTLLRKVKDKKDYASEFKTFDNYTKTAFDISPQTANNYILISEQFKLEDIGNLMLVTHLRVIAEIDNDNLRIEVLNAFKEIEEDTDRKIKKKAPVKKRRNEKLKEDEKIYRTNLQDVVATVSMLMDSGKVEYTKKEIKETVQANVSKGEEQLKKKKRAKRQQKASDNKDKFGDKFTCEFFKEVSALIDNEPIDEMGVVALFCLMFYSIRGNQFLWKNETISFVAIKYIRAAFPDASIRCKGVGRKNYELNIEFEFESYNYIRHGHLKQNDKCDMIICWNENARTDEKLKDKEAVKKMPPILSLKKCFETGEIELI